jgi:DNA-directed RNA polymerase specialized sigma24 family protein
MEYDNIQARALIKKLMYEYELTNKECAIMLGISDSSFRNKLSRGTFKLSEYTKLLKCLNVKVVYSDEN